MGIAIVAAFSAVAFSASAATSAYISFGTGSNSYYSGCGGCPGFSAQSYYGDYGFSNYQYQTFYPYNYGGNFWDVNYRAPRFNNPPRPNPQAPITISGLGFNVPARPQGNAGTPVVGGGFNGAPVAPTPVCLLGTSWNGSACVASSVICPAGQAFNAGLNICLPYRSY